jgi:UDP-N-acetylglucosamine--N-acetylmuramyl-(pentapeptide) pyrophosphoryl-undecaprenol N-acetylglucosamine transferase
LSRTVSRKLKICLAASGGGHLRQLLDMTPAWAPYNHFLVTEDTSLSRSLQADYTIHYLPHFAFGQARMSKPIRMVLAGIANFLSSARIILKERPTLVITTGAGSVFFCALFSRLIGARVIVIETFARFDRPSMFARMAMPFAYRRVVQSAKLANVWPDTRVFEPFKVLETRSVTKERLLFATVGATLPFPRLLTLISAAKSKGAISERIVAQTGESVDLGPEIEVHPSLPNEVMRDFLKKADIVVCHGGTGSIVTAMREGCQVIAIPRRSQLSEHYDDHQSEIISALKVRGLIQSADTVEDLIAAIETARTKPRIFATTDTHELNGFLAQVLAEQDHAGEDRTAPAS